MGNISWAAAFDVNSVYHCQVGCNLIKCLDNLDLLSLPVPDAAGSRTDLENQEEIRELESGMKAEDKHIRDARWIYSS